MATVFLPHGFAAADGTWHREAELRPVAEQDLWAARLPAGARAVTAFLARCLTRLGPYAPVTGEQVAALTAGDREALLLHLRRISFGDSLDCVVGCGACGARMELTLNVSDLLLPPYEPETAWRAAAVDGHAVRLRAPTGADLEAVAAVAEVDREGAAEVLVRRCVHGLPAELAPGLMEQVSELMQGLDPQADLLLDFVCPECGVPGQAGFSAAEYLMREVLARQEGLLREIHYLALHYHWSEAEILAVEPTRRRSYLRLLGLLDADGEELS